MTLWVKSAAFYCDFHGRHLTSRGAGTEECDGCRCFRSDRSLLSFPKCFLHLGMLKRRCCSGATGFVALLCPNVVANHTYSDPAAHTCRYMPPIQIFPHFFFWLKNSTGGPPTKYVPSGISCSCACQTPLRRPTTHSVSPRASLNHENHYWNLSNKRRRPEEWNVAF